VTSHIETIKQALSRYGACVMSMLVGRSLYFYIGGIYDGMVNGVYECENPKLHQYKIELVYIYFKKSYILYSSAMLLVGYNSNSTGDYWIIRNSWGTNWGDNGHLYLKISDNLCQSTKTIYCPVVENF
jgi:hypothetical protein